MQRVHSGYVEGMCWCELSRRELNSILLAVYRVIRNDKTPHKRGLEGLAGVDAPPARGLGESCAVEAWGTRPGKHNSGEESLACPASSSSPIPRTRLES